jgi:cytochrome c556
MLDQVAGENQFPGPEQFDVLARKAQWVADRIAEHDPCIRPAVWQYHTAKMRLAALDLAQAARTDDRAAILTAARQLDATCINCHEVFRVRTALGSDSESWQLPR